LLNGRPADAEPAALRALAQSNYGHFTALRVRDGAVQGLELHFERLRRGNAELFGADLDERVVRGWMQQAAAAAGGGCSLRVALFSRQFDLRQPEREMAVDVLVTAADPPPAGGRPLRVRSCRFQRPVPHLKHVGTFPLHHHRRQARLAGWDDVLFVDGADGDPLVVEGSVWNIGFWAGDGVVWPQAPALRGITERLLQEGLAAQGVAQVVRPVALAELAGFQAAFAANAHGLQPIAAIDAVEYADAAAPMRVLAAAGAHAPWEPLG
jgi:branched-subunit amino acid aminotransferase/4-amino-4-deoxychorismate lyase